MGANGIQLDRMNQLTEALGLGDVWTGITDPVERKRRQNRLNQRAFKKRRAAQLAAPQGQELHGQQPVPDAQVSFPRPQHSSHTQRARTIYGPQPLSSSQPSPIAQHMQPNEVDIIFPLPLDNLLTLVQFNVLRAMVTNMQIMSLTQQLSRPCEEMYSILPKKNPYFDSCNTAPPTFDFTALQKSTPHQQWIDIVPCAQLRDNLIIATTQDSSFDGDAFCIDLVGGIFEGHSGTEMRGLLVWADPWSPCGWEVSEGFLEKWGHLLKGCLYMLLATNKWRATRGEEALVWEV